MADKADKKSKDEDAKAISSSDLDPDELAKAIEQSVAQESKAAEDDAPKKDTQSSDKKTDKPEEKPANLKSEDDDKGTPIIVKRRSGYVTPPTDSTIKSDSTDESKPIEPPSKTQKVLDPTTTSDNPAVTVPTEEKITDDAGSPQEVTKEAKPAKEEAPAPAPTSEESAKPQEESGSTANTSSAGANLPKDDNKHAPEGAKDPTEPQKPTVFDTTEYHLPIKARNRKYVNSAVAWVVLSIALTLAAGYVFYRLGVVEFGDLT